MKRRWTVITLVLMILCLMSTAVLAQDDACPEIVEAALDVAHEQCSGTGRNQICYGNVNLDATPRSDVEDFSFSTPGDVVAVTAIESLTLSSKVEEEGEWGVAVMQLQANLPDTLPGQNILFLLFGSVEIANGVESETESDAETTDAPLNPMQAFFFRSGIGDAPCAGAPDSGILVQTPDGAAQIQFTVNEVKITLGSTAFLQAQPDGEMTASVVEGEATVEAGGVSVTVPEGSLVRVPLDDQGLASGPPSQPEPYDDSRMAVLPIRILPREITIAAPISESTSPGVLPAAGEWQLATTGEPTAENCQAAIVPFTVSTFTPSATFQFPEGEFNWDIFFETLFGASLPPSPVFSTPEPATYVVEQSGEFATWHYTVRVVDSEHMEGQFDYTQLACSIVIPFELTRVGE